MIDRTFGGRYRLDEKAGSGGMAEVYKAFDTTLDRTVAVKVLHSHYAGEEDSVARFKREAQAAANLNQPNIVNVYDWGAEDGTYYLVMEYIVGKNLKEIIEEEGPLPPERVVDIGRQVASALQAAHKHEIVHRDIKPENIIITDDGGVKVTDFGIARTFSGNVTQTASIIGTANYLSPEQAKGETIGASSDIYSLGVVLYEMLTGKVPFEGDGPVAVALKHIQETPIPPSELVGDVPEDLENIIMKAMDKNPGSRFRTAADLRDDLIRVAAGMPARNTVVDENADTMVIPKPVVPKSGRRRSRRVWKIIGVSLLFLVLFAASAYATGVILGRTAKIEVPDVKGLSAKKAEAKLDKKGLKFKISREVFDDDAPKGTVISQSPAAGKSVKEGGTVKVTVSKGLELVAVPDLGNMILNQATFSLSQRDLNLGSIRRDYSETIAEDSVITQDPSAGKKVKKGTYVNLVISRGPQLHKTPQVTGKNVAEAEAIITDAELKYEVIETYNDRIEAGEVISQSPAAGVSIKKGDTVTISVSKGPELFSVPDLSGLTEAEAKQELSDTGFGVSVDHSVSDPDSYGLVVTQQPEAGSKEKKGETVTIWIGIEPAGDGGGD